MITFNVQKIIIYEEITSSQGDILNFDVTSSSKHIEQ